MNKLPIYTTCNCGKGVTMIFNGHYHSANCSCGRNIRKLIGTLIIELKRP
jgi:hypothetical protein